jgi:adenylyltransferase/sulfurtransferase
LFLRELDRKFFMTLRYSRQITLPEIGLEGQERLRKASVLCIGVGGLGCSSLPYLAASGIGRIGLMDGDYVDLSNLQRQVLFSESDEGSLKVEAAARALHARNHDCILETYATAFDVSHAENLLTSYDVIIDGTDNFPSKFLLNDSCVKYDKPLVYGSVLGFKGHVSVFHASQGPCYRCLYPEPPTEWIPNCAEAGVLGAMVGIVGAAQGLEALKAALGWQWCHDRGLGSLLGQLWVLDMQQMRTHILSLQKDKNCSLCGQKRDEIGRMQTIEEKISSIASVRGDTLCSAHALLKNHVFVDVREEHELRETGKILGACHIPLGVLLSGMECLDGLEKEQSLLIYCLHGKRSYAAAEHLKRLGYPNVCHLAGGITEWEGPIQGAE